MSEKTLHGLTALISGAGKGIGRACALELAAHGADVVLVGRNLDNLNEVAQSASSLGVRAEIIQADLQEAQSVNEIAKKACELFGNVDILVNNAGVTKDNLLIRMKEEEWDKVLDVNLRASFLLSKAFAKSMMKKRFGRIINVVSVVGQIGNSGQANYCASKAGLIGLTKAMARELAVRNITVNAVAPGYIQTDMTKDLPEAAKNAIFQQIPMEKLGQPEDVARAVCFFAEPGSSYITGQVLNIDGGMVMQ